MAEKIFVSYAHQDRDLVGSLEQTLRQHRVVTGQDVIIVDPQKKVQAGENIRERIKNEISSASKVVIIVSESSAASQWINYEAGMATALGKPIVIIGKKGIGKSALVGALENVQFIEI
jgi:hypothetical protein